MAWPIGTKLVRKHNLELGVGVVLDVDGPFIDVFFPDVMEQMRLRPDPESVSPVVFSVGDDVVVPGGDVGDVSSILTIDGESVSLQNGQTHSIFSLWPVLTRRGALERLLDGDVDLGAHVLNRLDGIRLRILRRSGGVAGLLGGRIDLFPHQLGTAVKALGHEKVRWLLADEVGLGKTIVAHMITSSLLMTGRVSRVVVIAPETLTVQWLGELYRKFHHIFVYIDSDRINDIRVEIGDGVNPFDIYPLSIVSLEFLEHNSGLLSFLKESVPDLVVVDEAHRTLSSPLGGIVRELVGSSPHALMLTATPFQMGEEGFSLLVDALGLPYDVQPNGLHVVRQVSAITREEVRCLPCRHVEPVKIPLIVKEGEEDPRVQWLVEKLLGWRKEKRKALVFVNEPKTAQDLHDILIKNAGLDVFTFDDNKDYRVIDVELSRFKFSLSPALISSGVGSEGRNFQFCDYLVHFDLPEDPTVLEQRIGRLDRIGRNRDISMFYFVPDEGESELVTAYTSLGVFDEASVGASPAMAILRDYFSFNKRGFSSLEEMIECARFELSRHEGQWLFVDSHQQEDDDAILEQLPEDPELLFERFCVDAAERIGMDIVEKEQIGTYFFEHGTEVTVGTIPGVPRGSRFLGTFDREEAIDNLELDFFANGHVLVEGFLSELDDSSLGRVGAIRLARRRIAVEFDLEMLSSQYYLLLIQGGIESKVDAFVLQDGVFVPLASDVAMKLFDATEHGVFIGKKVFRECLHKIPNLVMPECRRSVDCAVWIEWT